MGKLVKSDKKKDRKRVFKVLEEMVDIISRHAKKKMIARIFRDLLPKEAFFQAAELTSNLRPFPGGYSSIGIAKQAQGGFIPDLRHMAKSPKELFGVFSDHLHRTLNNLFYISNPIDKFPFKGLFGSSQLTPMETF